MDLESIVTGLAIIALLTALVLYFQRRNKASISKQLEDFIQTAEKLQLNISEKDVWEPGYAIGIDAEKMKLLYTRSSGSEKESAITLLDLTEVDQGKVLNINRDVNGGRTVDRIELSFAYRSSGLPEQVLEFYSREGNLNLQEELRLAKKWRDIVHSNLLQAQANTIKPSLSRQLQS